MTHGQNAGKSGQNLTKVQTVGHSERFTLHRSFKIGAQASLNQPTTSNEINKSPSPLSAHLVPFCTPCTDKTRTISVELEQHLASLWVALCVLTGEAVNQARLLAVLLVALLLGASAFGQPDDPPQPKWLDTQTKMELGASAMAFAADGWTTRRNFANATSFCNANNRVGCFIEYNPLLRPAVDSDLKVSAYFAGAFGAQIGANWLLRKHPRERHVLNWAVIGLETFWASYNTVKRRY